MTTRICDLPSQLVGEILMRVPITSLRAVRSTCKLWNVLTKGLIVGKAGARQQFLGFLTMDSKVCSVRFHLCGSKDKDVKEDLLDLSIKQVDLLNQVDIFNVFHCDGLLLCVAKDYSGLVVWNPYLGQKRWVAPRTDFHRVDRYALGYDIHRHHKILRFAEYGEPKLVSRYEIYELRSNSWKVLKFTPDWDIGFRQRGVSVKGNTYFFAHEKIGPDFSGGEDLGNGCIVIDEIEDFLICFDFTKEKFGSRLPIPFHSYNEETVTLSCVREAQLAILYQHDNFRDESPNVVQIWVTTLLEPNSVSWSKFLKVEMGPFARTGVRFDNYNGGSFFIDEEERVVVVFDVDGYLPTKTARYHTAFIMGEDGYYNAMSLGVAPKLEPPCPISGYVPEVYYPPLVCTSSYHPSLVTLDQLRKRKERNV